MEIFVSSNPEKEAGEAVTASLQSLHDTPVLLLVSGGSAFKLLASVDVSLLSERCTLGVLDERYSLDPAVNNFAQLTTTSFYTDALVQGVHFIDTRVQEHETILELRERFDTCLHTWFENNPTGIILATVGIGNDGHTAGIFPMSNKECFEGSAWTCAYQVLPKINQYTERVTVTHSFLREMVTHAFVYVEGNDKKDVLQKVLDERGDLEVTPARIFRELSLVSLYTDIFLENKV
jgi:6-phosphogluconolactonase/glucosamine-6-phosphate isomerase/deaminase